MKSFSSHELRTEQLGGTIGDDFAPDRRAAGKDGDAIGGSINLKTKTAFSQEGHLLSVSGEGVYNDFAQKWGHKFGLTYGWIVYALLGSSRVLSVSSTSTLAIAKRIPGCEVRMA